MFGDIFQMCEKSATLKDNRIFDAGTLQKEK